MMTAEERILFVDDEPHVLAALVRQLRNSYHVDTATSGTEALGMLNTDKQYAVILSDLRMPGMDGIDLLREVKKQFPNIIRIILTGEADLVKAIEAVNRGQVFRFLTKPCSTNTLATTLALALRQYQLIVGEQQLLERTLKGSIAMLSEVLGTVDPRAFSRGHRIRGTVVEIAENLGMHQRWRLEVAALLSQIGCIAIPDDILNKVAGDIPLDEREKSMFAEHPRIGSRLIGRVPRLEGVAAIIEKQLQAYEDTHLPGGDGHDDEATGAHILKAALDYDQLASRGVTHEEALRIMYGRRGVYNPEVLQELKRITPRLPVEKQAAALLFDELVPGMVAAEDIVAQNGTRIIEKGQEITWPALQGLQNFITHIGIREPIRVWV